MPSLPHPTENEPSQVRQQERSSRQGSSLYPANQHPGSAALFDVMDRRGVTIARYPTPHLPGAQFPIVDSSGLPLGLTASGRIDARRQAAPKQGAYRAPAGLPSKWRATFLPTTYSYERSQTSRRVQLGFAPEVQQKVVQDERGSCRMASTCTPTVSRCLTSNIATTERM